VFSFVPQNYTTFSLLFRPWRAPATSLETEARATHSLDFGTTESGKGRTGRGSRERGERERERERERLKERREPESSKTEGCIAV
jgi:hypothetical protein